MELNQEFNFSRKERNGNVKEKWARCLSLLEMQVMYYHLRIHVV